MPGTGAAVRVPACLCALACAMAVLVSVGGCGSSANRPDRGGRAKPAESFWVNPQGTAARQVRQWQRQGRVREAESIKRIADHPVAEWFARPRPGPRARALVEAAARQRRTALFVAYEIPHRDCGQYSTGGAPDAVAYRRWIDELAAGIGDHSATVVLEPDAVAHMVDGCTHAAFHEERYELLAYAVRRLKRQPATKVYLDAANSSWIPDPDRMVGPLQRAGVADADGFAVNVANFETTEASRSYGHLLSGALDGAHFVIDTSRNGNGPAPRSRLREAWCNPPGRALGTPPTTDTGDPLVDAFLWIKRPGDSDGQCRGGPPAGQWWPDYALGLTRDARNGKSEQDGSSGRAEAG
ncbi:glycoside hydrolase family 6 protein [Wenjunlia tyrosinilytica]|uniref:Glucanase n=1 Tax=Wenjunlia tyrosinilytica TaxID=1544741 RepID=A0A917ZT44_9ACTN|nr:glycoside hydrolase family 6 protein [Wenjunlia tyrosinilytica]GGO89437.1 glucanase [Wenjunlia tyrosinilytica]